MAQLLATGEPLCVHAEPAKSRGEWIRLRVRVGDVELDAPVDSEGYCRANVDLESESTPPRSLPFLLTVLAVRGWYVLVDYHVTAPDGPVAAISLTATPPAGHGLSTLALQYGTELIDIKATWRPRPDDATHWELDQSATGLRASSQGITLDGAGLVAIATSAAADWMTPASVHKRAVTLVDPHREPSRGSTANPYI